MPSDPDGSSSASLRLPPPTATQVQAHRFAVRRLESALVGRDPTPRYDPGRRQNRALLVGAVLGVLALVGFAVVGLIRGDEGWRDEAVVRGEPSGALYAVAHGPDRLVPALNLTSARLLAAAAGNTDPLGPPVPVRDDLLAQAPRTAPAGIPGAPSVLPDPAAPVADAWAVCDRVTLDPSVPDPAADPALTTVALGGVPSPGRPLAPDEALLLRGPDGAFWLVTDGRRALITPQAGAVVRGLELTGARARAASPALLGTLPQGPPLEPVTVPGSGATPTEPRTAALGVRTGDVVSPDGARFFLVAADGVQEVPAVVAQLARFANPDPAADPGIAAVPAGRLADAPRVAVVDVRAYPATFPRPVTYDAATTVCVRPDAGGPERAGTAAVFAGPALPGPAAPTPLVGPPLDGAWVAGGGAYVVPVGEPPVLVDPGGRVYPVPDPAAASALGLGVPRPAPRAVLDLLPRGPALDPLAAQTAR
ncbi:type VII secretion protein EccB [Actinomycetospora succinea]|uniref:Type VII secretion protein EccB n=1 Tax=Actinomycetospora succinea TaxID=663603 RepID=A0A4R6UX08_9PSEU|nr:type VII secretion protein EccB [Actinomycetospora succinea]TDQ51741.1 type VII secretion protein EccB [Actinomycetospora succinea]